MRWVSLCAMVCAFACGPSTGDADGGGGGDASTAEDPSAGGEESLMHGVVKLAFAASVGGDFPFGFNAAQIVATLTYRDCLEEFYANNPSMRQDGLDGAPVFGTLADGGEGWIDRLCDGASEHVPCEVLSIDQELDVGTPKLTVVYAISGELEGRQLRVGPFPTAQTAECQGGTLPELGVGDVKGFAADGTEVWTAESFDPTKAVVGEDGAITIHATPS